MGPEPRYASAGDRNESIVERWLGVDTAGDCYIFRVPPWGRSWNIFKQLLYLNVVQVWGWKWNVDLRGNWNIYFRVEKMVHGNWGEFDFGEN